MSTSLAPSRQARWSGLRGPVAIGLVVLAGALVLALVASRGKAGTLDPRAVDRRGSKALAEVLRAQGVRVDLVQTTDAAVAAAGPGTTVLVAIPDLLVAEQAQRLAVTRADLVLISATGPALDRLAPGVRAVDQTLGGKREPRCDFPPAVRAGDVDLGGVAYQVAPGPSSAVVACYSRGSSASFVRTEDADGRSVTVLGSGRALTNERLGQRGNAALTLAVLGHNEHLVWYLPSLADVPPGATRSPYSLIPSGVKFATLQLFLAVLVLALWRGRRLGAVVVEPLPVVVRAAESVEGRARLYRKVGARDSAALALRRAALARLRPALNLPRRADPQAVVAAVAARTGRPGSQVGALLYGAAPGDDAALVALASSLDQLDREARRP